MAANLVKIPKKFGRLSRDIARSLPKFKRQENPGIGSKNGGKTLPCLTD